MLPYRWISIPLFGLLLSLSCASSPSSEQRSTSASETTSAMSASDFVSVRYTTGNPDFRGRTTVFVQQDGSLLTEFLQGEQTQTHTKQLSAKALSDLVQSLTELGPCNIQPERKNGNPDEDDVLIEWTTAAESCELRFWINERWQNPALKELVELFRALAAQAEEE